MGYRIIMSDIKPKDFNNQNDKYFSLNEFYNNYVFLEKKNDNDDNSFISNKLHGYDYSKAFTNKILDNTSTEILDNTSTEILDNTSTEIYNTSNIEYPMSLINYKKN